MFISTKEDKEVKYLLTTVAKETDHTKDLILSTLETITIFLYVHWRWLDILAKVHCSEEVQASFVNSDHILTNPRQKKY